MSTNVRAPALPRRQREGSYMAYLIRGRELGANTDLCVFALLGGAALMLAFASLHAPKPRPPAQVDELRSYQVIKGHEGYAQKPVSVTTPTKL